jgi:hypothetical protein
MPQIILNWDAYYEQFAEAHGLAIMLEDRVVFADGWSYLLGADKHPLEGGEVPPPESVPDQLELKRKYWEGKANILAEEARILCRQIRTLIQLQESHSLPLQHIAEPKEGVHKIETVELPIKSLVLKANNLLLESNLAKEQARTVVYVPPAPKSDYADIKLSLAELEKALCT